MKMFVEPMLTIKCARGLKYLKFQYIIMVVIVVMMGLVFASESSV